MSRNTTITQQHFGYHKGREVVLFRLTNASGNYVELINYGAAITSIVVPGRNRKPVNVVLGFPNLEGYVEDKAYIGATIGRFANRIGNASFSIKGEKYSLDKNDGANNNHSGFRGFNSKVFDFKTGSGSVTFLTDSPDGEGGFPGNLKATITYKWTDANELLISYVAETDKPTPVNFTNHVYFNLSGKEITIHDHKLSIASNFILDTTPDYIPTGKVLAAGDKVFYGQNLGEVMKGGGLNDFYIFDKEISVKAPVCILLEENSGILMQVYTTYPGVQLYTGDFLNSVHKGHGSSTYKAFNGVCLECQYYPDSPNHADFPETIVQPGQTYEHSITYAFGTL